MMSWEREPLWAKSQLFFEHAMAHDRDDPRFGLWCTFGLELLARAAVSSISPALLAEPDRDHKHLLHALGRGNAKVGPVSLGAAQVFRLCETLFPEFSSENVTAAVALVNRRNAELHSGEAAFAEYTTQQWLPGFYSCCKALAVGMNETLASLLGDDEANEAESVIAASNADARKRAQDRIAHYRAVFGDKTPEQRDAAQSAASAMATKLAHHRHHQAKCPACSSAASVQGDPIGTPRVEDEDGEIVVRQAISPRKFACEACGLKLDGYAELAGAGLANHYTRTTTYSPQEYYELLDPTDYDEIARIADERLGMVHSDAREYDNE